MVARYNADICVNDKDANFSLRVPAPMQSLLRPEPAVHLPGSWTHPSGQD